jgi:L-amino acid N-acyltransferase
MVRMRIRDASIDDIAAINDLANIDLATTTVVWADTPRTLEQRLQWFTAQQAAGNAVLVAETDDDPDHESEKEHGSDHVHTDGPAESPSGPVFLGFAAYMDFRDSVRLNGYRFVAEHTIHITKHAKRLGVATALMDALEARALAHGKHSLIGVVDGENPASLTFHERRGYVEVGRVPEVGWKLDRWLTMVLVQKILDPGARR